MFFLAPVIALFLAFQQADEPPAAILAPYLPTPDSIVEKMLQMGHFEAAVFLVRFGNGVHAARYQRFDAADSGARDEARLARGGA